MSNIRNLFLCLCLLLISTLSLANAISSCASYSNSTDWLEIPDESLVEITTGCRETRARSYFKATDCQDKTQVRILVANDASGREELCVGEFTINKDHEYFINCSTAGRKYMKLSFGDSYAEFEFDLDVSAHPRPKEQGVNQRYVFAVI